MKTPSRFIVVAVCLFAAGSAWAADTVPAPRDLSAGMATGRRMHKPLTIVRRWSGPKEAKADCDKLGGVVSNHGGKLICTAEAEARDNLAAACAKVTAILVGAQCGAGKSTSTADDWTQQN